MSLLARGRRRYAAVVATGALFAFQALAIIGAGSASALAVAQDCDYNALTDTVTVKLELNENATIGVVDMTPGGAADEIQITASNGTLAAPIDCGSATVSNTLNVVVLGSGAVAGDEVFTIDNRDTGGDFGAVGFSIDMGNNTALAVPPVVGVGAPPGGDSVVVLASDDLDDVVSVTNTTFDINGGVGEWVGTEFVSFFLGDGDDEFDGSGASAFGFLVEGEGDDDTLAGGGGNDSIYGGAGDDFIDEGTAKNGADELYGNGGFDWLSYAGRSNPVNISQNNAVLDNDDGEGGCIEDGGGTPIGVCEGDDIWGNEILEGGAGADRIEGDESGAWDEYFVGNGGDDTFDGQTGFDIVSYFTTSDAVTMPVVDETASSASTGTDTWSDMEGAEGSASDADLLDLSGFAGPVNATLGADGVFGLVTGAGWLTEVSDFENAIGTAGNDTFTGNQYRNTLWGGAGNDTLSGMGGNDTFYGGTGNDSYTGGSGFDTADFGDATGAGIIADVSLGFATARSGGDSGDDSFGDFVEQIKGTEFNDTITGGKTGFGSGVNFNITGRGGRDILTGSDSNDTLKGGAGNDKLRGGPGDDTLKGGKGKDRGWGGPGTDICKKIEKAKGCEA